jgi:arylesterase/paraoxonase
MKYIKYIGLIVFVLIVGFVLNVLITTGYFRTIVSNLKGELIKKVELVGAEDIVVCPDDSFAIISATDRNIIPKLKSVNGLYYLSLKDNKYVPELISSQSESFNPHGISILKKDSIYIIGVVNHHADKKQSSIEIFELKGKTLTHIKTHTSPLIISPNDLVLMDRDQFYFTNDHKYLPDSFGGICEDYLGLAVSNVVYFDGVKYQEAAKGIAYANGINYDKERNLMFVASPRSFSINVYSVLEDKTLGFIESIDCNTGVDNIEFDNEGNIWVAGHPNLLHFSAYYKKGKPSISPSEVIKIKYISKGNYTIEQFYENDGSEMSGSTVAATFGNLVLVGNVTDDHFLVIRR